MRFLLIFSFCLLFLGSTARGEPEEGGVPEPEGSGPESRSSGSDQVKLLNTKWIAKLVVCFVLVPFIVYPVNKLLR
jgi:hypothetical protein